MNIKIVDGPEAEPVTVDEAKASLRVYGTYSDDLLSALITGGRQWAENYTGCSWAEQTYDLILDSVPEGKVRLYYPPVDTLDAVTVIDNQGAAVTCSTGDWVLDPAGAATLKSGARLPEGVSCTIRYTCGSEDVPEIVKQAILLWVKGTFEDIPGPEWLPTAERLLYPYKELRV